MQRRADRDERSAVRNDALDDDNDGQRRSRPALAHAARPRFDIRATRQEFSQFSEFDGTDANGNGHVDDIVMFALAGFGWPPQLEFHDGGRYRTRARASGARVCRVSLALLGNTYRRRCMCQLAAARLSI